MRIGIVGGTGAMGQLFRRFFEKEAQVLISSRRTKLTKEQMAPDCDIVMVSVPIAVTEQVIREVGPHVREDALLCDLTSVKEMPVRAMLRWSRSGVIGLHPVFGPSVRSLRNRIVVVCRARPNAKASWLISFLKRKGAMVSYSSPRAHDKMMAIVQVLRIASTLGFGGALAKAGKGITETMAFRSPMYQLAVLSAARLVAQDAKMYADIALSNRRSSPILRLLESEIRAIRTAVERGDRAGIIRKFGEVRRYFGKAGKKLARQSDALIEALARLR